VTVSTGTGDRFTQFLKSRLMGRDAGASIAPFRRVRCCDTLERAVQVKMVSSPPSSAPSAQPAGRVEEALVKAARTLTARRCGAAERRAVVSALEAAKWRTTLHAKMKKLGIHRPVGHEPFAR
jgi:hypothetical protein